MIDLDQLARRFDERVPVRLTDGRTVSIVRVRASTSRAIRDALPMPVPTRMVKDPTRGSLAPLIPDETDPAHRRALEQWHRRVQAAEIAFALIGGKDIDTLPAAPAAPGAPAAPESIADAAPGAFASWCDQCSAILADTFTLFELATLSREALGIPAAPDAPDAPGDAQQPAEQNTGASPQ